jgi:hypothetical protein
MSLQSIKLTEKNEIETGYSDKAKDSETQKISLSCQTKQNSVVRSLFRIMWQK